MAGGWTFHVRGSFVRARTGIAISACEAIVESGNRDEASPFRMDWVGRIAYAASDGTFSTTFGTKGATEQIEAPSSISVFVRTGPGVWLPHVVPLAANCAEAISPNEMRLRVGPVQIDESTTLYVG